MSLSVFSMQISQTQNGPLKATLKNSLTINLSSKDPWAGQTAAAPPADDR